MKSRLLALTVIALVTALLAFTAKQSFHPAHGGSGNRSARQQLVIRCSPDWNVIGPLIEDLDIPPIPGAGNYKWKISTRNDSAQFYFNQGINMYYSFHIIEAMASFKKASKFDPNAAMLHWAQALAYGPNINDLGYAASPDALVACAKADELSASASDKEIQLIKAQKVRYSEDSTENRAKLNQDYADRMKAIYERYPNDADVAALYADAMMLQHPWDLWMTDGKPKPWTPRIIEVLEKLLAKTPNHPGANHYYIHVMEPSPFAYKALPSADRMGKLTPGLSHTVHMPSHIYLRTGNYAKGITVNEAAVKSYQRIIPIYGAVTGNDFLYIIHNLHMQTNHAMLEGLAAYSVKSAKETVSSIQTDYLSMPPPMGNYVQYIYYTPVLVDIRFGNWGSLLKNTEPDKQQVYGNLLYHFGRGMAFANTGSLPEAKKELQALREWKKDSSLLEPFSPFSPPVMGATVAENLLTGTIAMNFKDYKSAISFFKTAVETEENMVYDEPRDWMLNPKHFLANAYLKAGQYDEAIKILEKDLLNNRENGWALFGIWQALTAKHQTSAAASMLSRFRKAFEKSDIKLSGPVF